MKYLIGEKGVLIYLLFLTLFANYSTAQNFGTDVFVLPDSNVYEGPPSIAIANNGWVYIAFSSSRPTIWSYGVYVSKDQGNSWQTLFQNDTAQGTRSLPMVEDLVVVGNDSTDLRLFIAYKTVSSAIELSSGFVCEYDGLTGNFLNKPLTFGDGATFDIYDVALATDFLFPSIGSSPFSIAVAYSEVNSITSDSVVVYISSDGGQTFGNNQLISTSQNNWKNTVDLEYAFDSAQSNGSFWLGFGQDEHLGICNSSSVILHSFSTPVYLDSISPNYINNVYDFSIAAQKGNYANTQGSYTVAVLTSTNSDILGFYNSSGNPQGPWQIAYVDTEQYYYSDTPSAVYDPTSRKYFASWINGDSLRNHRMECYSADYINLTNWNQISQNYCDSTELIMYSDSDPRLAVDHSSGILYSSWILDFGYDPYVGGTSTLVMIDKAQFSIGIPDLEGIQTFPVYPNPSDFEIRFQFKQEFINELHYSISTLDGKIVKKGSIESSFGKEYVLQIDSLAQGAYLLKLFSTKVHLISHFVKI